ncbi:MAG TPA: ABC transporter ATP-binding protein [Actinomycetota bacterium]|nr:ABC transporter ATP-binding protein [Actinomycetota bacterium]
MRGMWTMVRFAFQADAWRASASLVLSVARNAFEPVFALALKMIADAALAADASAVWTTAGLVTGALALVILSGWSGFHADTVLQEKMSVLIDRRLMDLAGGIPSIEHHERPDYHDQIELLRSDTQALSSVQRQIVENIGTVVRVGATAFLLARIHPALLALPLFAIPSLGTSALAESWRQRARERTASEVRLSRHLFDLATTPAPGKELRLFGLKGELVDRHDAAWRVADREQNRTALRGGALVTAGWLLFGIGYVGAVVFVVRRAMTGRATPGDVLLTLTLASAVNNQVQQSVMMLMWMLRSLVVVRRYLWLQEYAAERSRRAPDPAPVPARIDEAIVFEDVSFRYPGTETDVLTGVELTIPAGSTVAVVGDNGAGKSTLMKLLARFYEPTSGRMTLDGVDISRFDPERWRERLSAGFQDFARFEFVALNTVGVGRLPELDDETAVGAALGRAGAADVVDTLPQGLSTQLGRTFEGGVELSGGQWQKLALGRAMMRPDPLLLILDEPTASLDAETEHALFERYASAAGRVASETGAVTVLVSHRFSTVRMADLIVVIDGGRVVEHGSHHELMARGGLYAELFELQARAYR